MSNGGVKTFWAAVLAVCVLAPAASAEVRLANIIGSNMVLQREMPVPIWGWADAGEKVTVKFAGQTKTATAAADGKWTVKLDALETSAKPADMTVAGANTITLKNILVGEVWIGSGQSNMEMGVGGCLDAGKVVAAAKYPTMRLITVRKATSGTPRESFSGSWQVCSPRSAGRFSATLFFFGQKLHKELGVPIGLIHSSWGGTRVEPWTPPCGFAAVKSLKDISNAVSKANAEYNKALAGSISRIEAWVTMAKKALAENEPIPGMPSTMPKHRMNSSGAPTGLYNAMIHPLIPFAVRGATWYQGESNGGEGMSYFEKKKALIGGWRELWGYDLSFYFVQLANFRNPNTNPAGGDGWARVRDAQTATLSVPKTGMAVIIDIGMARNIHPKNKQDVGKRLALWALAKDYGKSIVYSGPMYKGMKREGKTIRLTFDHVGGGLIVGQKEGLAPTKEVPGGTLKQFAIAGADKKWAWADAKIDGQTVVVSSDKIPAPVAVRYAYSMNPQGCNLYNKEGLPAVPFRTDKW